MTGIRKFMLHNHKFTNEIYSDSDRSCNFLLCETVEIQICQVVLELYVKVYDKKEKFRLFEERYKFKNGSKYPN